MPFSTLLQIYGLDEKAVPYPRYGVLCAANGEREPLPFANAPLHFLTKSIRRRIFPALMPLVIAEPMRGNDVFPGCFPASAMSK